MAKLKGSERKPLVGAEYVAPVNDREVIEVSVYLRDPAEDELDEYLRQYRPGQPHMARDEYEANHSASHNDIKKVKQFAHEHNLTIVKTDPVSRKIVLAGPAAMLSKAFGTQLNHYEYQGQTYRMRQGELSIPAELEEVVVAVEGLDNRPQVHPRIQHMNAPIPEQEQDELVASGESKSKQRGKGRSLPPRPHAQGTGYTPLQIARFYDFPGNDGPNKLTGKGQCIGILEFGGGFTQTDLQTYFQQLGLPVPQVTSVSVDGGVNNPGTDINDPNNADGEVYLDIEVAGAIAPEAKIVVYFGGTDDGARGARSFADTLNAAIHDKVNNPTIISISWGNAEIEWTQQSWKLVHQALKAAAALGITVCAAAGDHGARDFHPDDPRNRDGRAHVDFPASDPFVLGCGGTSLQEVKGDQIISEVVWNNGNGWATGGGVSDFFDLPDWQKNAQVPTSVNPEHKIGRGVPDVGANADGETGYRIFGDGTPAIFGGTSAVAPLMAGLIARLNQANGGHPLGFINPVLYGNTDNPVPFRDITQGDNLTQANTKKYNARQGWDPCTGLGVPNFARTLSSRRPEEDGHALEILPAGARSLAGFDMARFLNTLGLEIVRSKDWNNVVEAVSDRLKV